MPEHNASNKALQGLLEHAGLWRGKQQQHHLSVVATGHQPLDRRLPGGGWPRGALTELMAAQPGLGEFQLLQPALAQVTQNSWAILIDPPWTPYPPALQGHGINLQRLLLVRTRSAQESLWACEQALSGMRNGAVLAWLQAQASQAGFSHLRRLQLAARQGHKLAFAFRPPDAVGRASPAALRLYLHSAGQQQLKISLIKCRGAHQGEQLSLQRPAPFIRATVNMPKGSSEQHSAQRYTSAPAVSAIDGANQPALHS